MPLLKGIAWDHPRGFDPMVATANLYKKKYSDVEIIWEKRPLQAFADRPIEEMAYQYDLMVIDHPHVGEASRKNLLLEFDSLSEFKNELSNLSDNSVGLSHQSYNFNNHQYALAIDAASPVAAYVNNKIETTPNNYEDVISLAEKSVVIWPLKPVDCISCFNTIAANINSPINEDNFIDKNTGILILKMMKTLSNLVSKDCFDMNPINVLDYMSKHDDKVYCPLLYGYSNYARRRSNNNLIRFVNIPSFNQEKNNFKGAQIGGTGLSISKESQYKDIAIDYAFWVASEDIQKNVYYFSGGQPGHLTAWKDNKINEDSNDFFINTLTTLQNSWLRPRYDGYMYFQDVSGTIINDFLRGDDKEELVIDKLIMEFEKSFYVNK